MEILKRYTPVIIAALFLVISAGKISGQSFTEKKDAFQKSYIQEATGDYSGAANTLREIYDENSYEVNLRLGWLTYLSGSFNESKAYYNKSIALMPYAVEPRFGYVYPSAAMGNWSEVIRQYEKIIEITPNNSIAMHRLGLIYYGRENYEESLRLFEKVVNLYPFDYDALTMLAWTHYRLNNMREARILFQKALLNTPNGTSAIEGLELFK
ncbi:MAG TPA: tetratricopeptide repeat protein [Bacteroidales bacterium]|nr:tetratricopeptide repeat protein [Bacteroidales bacterium]